MVPNNTRRERGARESYSPAGDVRSGWESRFAEEVPEERRSARQGENAKRTVEPRSQAPRLNREGLVLSAPLNSPGFERFSNSEGDVRILPVQKKRMGEEGSYGAFLGG